MVFNYPPELNFPVDIKTFYVKRCMAIPGDTLQLLEKQIYINGEAVENPPGMQTSYFVESDRGVNKRFMQETGITDIDNNVRGDAVPYFNPVFRKKIFCIGHTVRVRIGSNA